MSDVLILMVFDVSLSIILVTTIVCPLRDNRMNKNP